MTIQDEFKLAISSGEYAKANYNNSPEDIKKMVFDDYLKYRETHTSMLSRYGFVVILNNPDNWQKYYTKAEQKELENLKTTGEATLTALPKEEIINKAVLISDEVKAKEEKSSNLKIYSLIGGFVALTLVIILIIKR